MPRAIVCVTNDLSTDNRVHRTCTRKPKARFNDMREKK